ncbi:MAG TPA: efflux RND transporter periplasmic adaptor subunit [Aquabacterium sp.]|uniref:efflux RND transporter periplasmic adaptor subunit n=1 Tax=Aquabacterium sp. TaxID=1872578 RepID=UPI002E31FE5D|nr:efflux RND transporter periplasmic adaptor subunit [Aquabacterium sp.]HEX5372196.1 efflux RND transporter periplasmic adaptor subunit [Aquabacterium sp.]
MNKKALSVITATSMVWGGCSHAELLGCLIEPDRVADVGSQSTGVIEQLTVERGDMVTAGQVLARLSAQVERASLSIAEVKAKAEAEALQAQAAHELAQRKLERTRDLVRRDFVSDQALDQAEAEARVAEQRVAQARETQRVAQREFHLSNAQLSQREVRSPFAGLVVERFRTEGERIEREPVVRVARIDPLRIEAIVPAVQFGRISAGQPATVKTDLPDYPVLTAKVTLVDRVIDPASNSFRVRLILPNPGNRVPSGVRCRIAFGAADGAGAGASGVTPGSVAPPPSAAGQVSPARWSDVPQRTIPVEPSRAGVITVSVPPRAAVQSTALAVAASVPVQPARFISSTLKFAMAELGRTTPGRKWLEVPVDTPRVVAMGKSRAPALTTMAMTMQMPSLTPVGSAGAPATVVADAGKATAGKAPGASLTPVTGLRLASAR